MQFDRATLDTCASARGLVVVIDVVRAFTTAAYAFAAGANDILLVSSVEEALALRERYPGSLVMGEVNGLPPPGFDFGNSPSQIAAAGVSGRRLVQRTSAGTQGVVRSVLADTLLAASFVNARATAQWALRLHPEKVTFVETGVRSLEFLKLAPRVAANRANGDEDTACADYLQALLSGGDPDPAPFLERVRRSPSGQLLADPPPGIPAGDLDFCLQVNRFDFAMQAHREGGLMILNRIR
jgi:2-phosphosulfolactate phosphatase